MVVGKPGRGSDQFPLRLPDGMRGRLKVEAERNGQSMNSEIVQRLEATFCDPSAPGGMSLRDWFAGQALPGISFDCGLSVQEAAERAYEFADAMLAQREKR